MLLKCNRLKAKLASCEYEHHHTCMMMKVWCRDMPLYRHHRQTAANTAVAHVVSLKGSRIILSTQRDVQAPSCCIKDIQDPSRVNNSPNESDSKPERDSQEYPDP